MKTLNEILENIASEQLCPSWNTLLMTFDRKAIDQLYREAINDYAEGLLREAASRAWDQVSSDSVTEIEAVNTAILTTPVLLT